MGPKQRTWLLIALAAVVAAFLALWSAHDRAPRQERAADDEVEIEIAE